MVFWFQKAIGRSAVGLSVLTPFVSTKNKV